MNRARNYNLYTIFFTLYQTRNMRRAAEQLDLASHAHISKSIKQLEHELGVKLFITGQHGVTPTAHADTLYMSTTSLFAELQMLESNLTKLSTPQSTTQLDQSTIHLIIAGGTMDGEISSTESRIVPLPKSIVATYLRDHAAPHLSLNETVVTLNDSRDLTDEDLSSILATVLESPHENILITHGLYTIDRTAKYLSRFAQKLGNKRIFLVGSYFPIKDIPMSDATYNLGFAIASLPTAKPGIYTIIQGQISNSVLN